MNLQVCFFWGAQFVFAFRFSHVAEFGHFLKIGTAFWVSYRLSELHWYFDSYAHDAFAVLVVHCIEYTNMFSMFFHACKPDYIILLMWSLKFYDISKQEQCLNNTLLIRSALRCACVLLSVLTVAVLGLTAGKAKAGHSSEVMSLWLEVAALEQLLHEEVWWSNLIVDCASCRYCFGQSLCQQSCLDHGAACWNWDMTIIVRPSAEATPFEVSGSTRYPPLSSLIFIDYQYSS